MNGPGAGGGREGVLPEHLEYLSEAFKGPAGEWSGQEQTWEEKLLFHRERGEFHPEGGEEPWAGPGRDRSVPCRIHSSDVTALMSPLQLSKEEFNPDFC